MFVIAFVNALELKIPPAVLVLACAVVMWLAATNLPSLELSIPWRTPLAVALIGVGVIITLFAVIAFRTVKTTLNPLKPDTASTMVISGIYRLSRNPMYVGFLLALTGWATFLSNILAFAFLPAFVAYMNRFQISPEERALSTKFGAQFIAYKQNVRRWL